MTEEEKNEMLRQYYEQLARNGGCGSEVIMFCIILVMLFVFGCCPCKKITTGTTHNVSDSVEIKVEKYTEYIHDTLEVKIPEEKVVNVTEDTTSTVSTSLATSTATIKDGRLFHSIENIPQTLQIDYDKPVEHETVTQTSSHSETETSVQTEYVERDYTWWDKTRFYALYFIVAVLIVLYRKAIFKGIGFIIRKLVT